MGTFVTLVFYLALLTPLAYGLLTPYRRWARARRHAARLRIRVYPGSSQHLAALRAVDDQQTLLFVLSPQRDVGPERVRGR